MKQKIRDLFLLISQDKKYKWLLFAAAAAVVFLFFGPSEPKRVRRPVDTKVERTATTASTSSEAYNDIVARFNNDVNQLGSKVGQLSETLQQQKKSSEEYEEKNSKMFEKVLSRIEEMSTQTGGAGSNYPVEVDADNGGNQQLETIGLDTIAPEVPAQPKPAKAAYIGVGDSVRLKLLAGVNAPTDGTPYPVVFQLIGDVTGPDGSQLPLGEARVVAAAQGSLTDARALFRLTDLSIRLPSGERRGYKVDGWVVGEDGIRGMSGRLIDFIGEAIAGSAAAGALEGFGRGIGNRQITNFRNQNGSIDQLVTGNTGTYALGESLRDSTNLWADIIRERMNQLTPVVEVLSGREATAVFAKALVVDGLYEELDANESIYASLD